MYIEDSFFPITTTLLRNALTRLVIMPRHIEILLSNINPSE